jgi:hypothetical protein
LGCGSSGSPRAQLFARRLTGPGTRINLTYDIQPLFRLGECREITHVQAEALATLFKTATDEESEALEFGQIILGKRHRRRRRTQIQNDRPRLDSGSCCRVVRIRAPHGARSHIWRW